MLMLAITMFAGACAQAGTLDSVKTRGELICGVSDQVPGFAISDRNGRLLGLDVDFCRAVAVAVLGGGAKIVTKPMSRADGFRALAAGEIDLLAQASAWTLSNDTEFNIRFVDVLLYDGQGFLVPKTHGLSSVLELSGAPVCVVSDTRAQDALAGFFGRHRMNYQLVKKPNWNDLVAAYASGACTALTGDVTQLAAARRTLAQPSEHVMLPEFIAKEPLGPAVRIQDPVWFSVVRWVRMALVEAEELGIDSSNVTTMAGSAIEDVRRLLGVDSTLGQSLGLDADWARRMIAEVGNYAEIYERNFGIGSDLLLSRGYNKLWSRGGLMYGVPLR